MTTLLSTRKLESLFTHLLNTPLPTAEKNSLLKGLTLQQLLQLNKMVCRSASPCMERFIKAKEISSSRTALHYLIKTIYNEAINNLQTIHPNNLDHLSIDENLPLATYWLTLYKQETALKRSLFAELPSHPQEWLTLITKLLEVHKPDLSLELIKSDACQEMLKKEPSIRSHLAMTSLFYHQTPLFNCLKKNLSYSDVLDQGEGSIGYLLMGAACGGFVEGLDMLPKTYIQMLPPTGHEYSLDKVIEHAAMNGQASFLNALIAKGCQKIPSESLRAIIDCARQSKHFEVAIILETYLKKEPLSSLDISF